MKSEVRSNFYLKFTVGWVKRQRNPTQPGFLAFKLPSSNQTGNLGDVGFFRWKCSANVPQPNLQLKSCFCCTVGWVKRQRNPAQPRLNFALKLPSSNQPGNLGDVGFFRWKCSANVPIQSMGILLSLTSASKPCMRVSCSHGS
ncbi:MAG: hypothetical protein F6K40_00170 [Okeania sp. SIO3I5]|nr:hypothetical protein [Okeania sp. SIO3I5]